MFRDRTSSTKKARSHSFRKLTIMRRPRHDELMYHSMVHNASAPVAEIIDRLSSLVGMLPEKFVLPTIEDSCLPRMLRHRTRRWERPQSRTARALPNDR